MAKKYLDVTGLTYFWSKIKSSLPTTATDSKVGLVKGGGNCGTSIHSATGTIRVIKATNTEIDSKSGEYKPIVPSNLDYAVIASLSSNKLSMTDAQKQQARSFLGVDSAIEEAINNITNGNEVSY